MIEIKPKDEYYNFGYTFCKTLVFIAILGCLLYANSQLEGKLSAIAKAQLATAEFLESYVPEVESRFRQVGDQMIIVETVAPIYERRLATLENWKEETGFVTFDRQRSN